MHYSILSSALPRFPHYLTPPIIPLPLSYHLCHTSIVVLKECGVEIIILAKHGGSGLLYKHWGSEAGRGGHKEFEASLCYMLLQITLIPFL